MKRKCSTVYIVLCNIWFPHLFVLTVDLCSEWQNILEKILSSYDKRYPPHYNDEKPLEVQVQLYIMSLFDINEKDMKYSLSMYLRQQWTDPRLKYTAPTEINQIELDHEIRRQIWVPDLAFINDLESNVHYVSVPNKMMNIFPDGFVSYSMRVTGTYTCFMELQKFPFDEQTCVLEMESYGYSASILRLKWVDTAAEFDGRVIHGHFQIGRPTSYDCGRTLAAGNFSCIGITIPLKRRYMFYLLQVYAPSILIVVLSWVSFWLNIDAVPARVSLGILTVLTVSSSGNMSVGFSHHVSYIRAIDVWNITCLVLVFTAVVEYAYVCVSIRVQDRRRMESVNAVNCVDILLNKSKVNYGAGMTGPQVQFENKERARTVDKVSRIVFPVTFLIFNLIYWIYYMT